MDLNSRISDSILREATIKDNTVPYMVNKIETYYKDPPPTVTVDSFSENSINYEIKFWIADMSEISFFRNQLMMNIIETFTKNEIPLI